MSSGSDNNAVEDLSSSEFARRLRQKAEDAAAASIHHASLSQQYLALSQKFAGVAEQAFSGNRGQLQKLASSLDLESTVGTPAAPMGTIQVAASDVVPPAQKRSSIDLGEIGSTRREGITAQPPVPVAPQADAASPNGAALACETADQEPAARGRRRPRRRRVAIRDMVRQFHLKVPTRENRVRIRARRSDLKPKLRAPADDLKGSGRPAAIAALVCALIIAGLSTLQMTWAFDPPLQPIIGGFSVEPEPEDEEVLMEPPEEEQGEQLDEETDEPVEEPIEEPIAEPEPEESMVPSESERETSTEAEPAETAMSDVPVPSPAAAESEAESVDGRSAEGRKAMLQKYGGSAASESAVQRSLVWLASVQRRDGSWDFVDIGECDNPGTINNPIGGTAYALLPFLAAGQTHQQGAYRNNVKAGLDYLMKTGISVPAGLDLRGVMNKGNEDEEPNEAYYVHGAATLALCEAYWMTKDRRLKNAAEGAVRFLLNSQDPRGGGWRYLPQQAGSTSVTTIQVLALKAAEKGGIQIPDATWRGVMYYLDSVQVDRGGRYGYEIEKKSYQASITAMALLCRMYLGWHRDDGDLRDGVALLSRKGPYDNLYYNYFATQVMRHWGGEEWHKWNARLRDDLVRWQIQDGPATGSWSPRNRADYSVAGGRLLTTCLATLTLEVYYRYEPLLPDDHDITEK
jgi:hypothetical protein